MISKKFWELWHNHYDKLKIENCKISYDGILDYNKYIKSKIKILYILKETNDLPGGSLIELLENGPIYQTWYTVARWSAGIINRFPSFENINNFELMKTSLLQTAVINLKKITGTNTSDMDVIMAYTHQDQELLIKQIKEINPDLILACGTFMPLIWLLQLTVNVDNPKDKPVRSPISDSIVIPWKHPNRVNNKSTYLELRNIFNHHKPFRLV